MTPRSLTRPASGSLEEWFERRSYDHAQFSDRAALARRKLEQEVTVSVVLPTREVAGTVGGIIEEIRALGELVDQLLVVDAGSADGSADVAARHGAEVYDESDLLPDCGPVRGKGDAMWRALSVATGDVVMYLDSDTTDFGPHFVCGLLGPLLTVEGLQFVKGAYSRPWVDSTGVEIDSGGRVTELTVRPLFNLFYPELAGFAQPLAGELAASRELLTSIPFFTGYAVETGMLIDVLEAVGLDAMAQVDLGTRTNRNQPLFDLGRMAYEALRTVERRAGLESATPEPDRYVRAVRSPAELDLEQQVVEIVERPPLTEVLAR